MNYRRVGVFRVESNLGHTAVLDAFCLKFSDGEARDIAVKDKAYLRDFEVI
jgi:hypothetical protein